MKRSWYIVVVPAVDATKGRWEVWAAPCLVTREGAVLVGHAKTKKAGLSMGEDALLACPA